MPHRLTHRRVIVRYPSEEGEIVHKMQGEGLLVPDELHDHPNLIYQSVSDAATLTAKSVDRSGIDPDSKLADLLRYHWGVVDFS